MTQNKSTAQHNPPQTGDLTPSYVLGGILSFLVMIIARRLFGGDGSHRRLLRQIIPPDKMRGLALQAGESLSAGVRRMVLEQLDTVLYMLLNLDDDPDEHIHEARKSFKKARAVLRLVRDEIGEEVYHAENVTYRDASRLLSAVRDSAVMVEALDKLREQYAKELPPGAFQKLRENLVTAHEKFRHQVINKDNAPQQVIDIVAEARQRVTDLPFATDDFSALHDGLLRVYRRGWDAMGIAYDDPTTENFHEWRKRAKYLWYHMRILNVLWPEMLSEYADALDTLAEMLGDEHDLAELQNLAMENPRWFKDAAERERLLDLIAARRAELQAAARPLGERVYAESPEAFVQRIAGYWAAYAATA